jgi:MoxR-like ATPase
MMTQSITSNGTCDLQEIGRRWEEGEKISVLAKECGTTWNALHFQLMKLGFKTAGKGGPAVDLDVIRQIVKEEVAKAEKTASEAVPAPDCKSPAPHQPIPAKPSGKTHREFAKVLKLAQARRNILLVGPAGSGKTHLAEQLAGALQLPFAHISCSAGMSEGQLLGRLVPTGEAGRFEYVRSDFVRCYEEGGVFLFDEIDAADSNTLLIVNAALANGAMSVPNRPGQSVAHRHPDFICVAAANTFGTGADRQYVGRNQLDESTLDRFRIGQIEMDYDAEVEASLCPDSGLRARLLAYRARVRQAGLRRVVSMRFLRDSYVMKEAGFTDDDIDGALFRGWSPDEIRKVS